MGKHETVDWSVILGFFVLVGLIAAIMKLGAVSFVLSADLKEAQCAASYWKARNLGHPANYCPDGCTCERQTPR